MRPTTHTSAPLAAALLCLLASGCPGPTSGEGPAAAPAGASGAALTQVSIQLNWLPEPQFGGIYEAQRSGAFARQGLEVTIRKGGPDVPAVQMAAAGQVEFALAAADEVLRIRAGGAQVVSLFATYQTAPQGVLTLAGRGLDGLEALWKAPGTLAVQPGLSYVEFLRRRFGEPTAQLVAYQGGVAQLLASQEQRDFAQQCFVTSEPIAARRAGVDPQVFLIAETGFNPYTSVVIAREDYLDAHPEVARGLVAALREGWRAYLDDPGPANALMAELNPSLDAETFRLAAEAQVPLIETEATRARGLGDMTLERWQQLEAQLRDLGSLPVPVDPAGCYRPLPQD